MAWNTSQREDNFQFPLKLLKIMNHESIYFWACKVSQYVCMQYTGSPRIIMWIHFGQFFKIRIKCGRNFYNFYLKVNDWTQDKINFARKIFWMQKTALRMDFLYCMHNIIQFGL